MRKLIGLLILVFVVGCKDILEVKVINILSENFNQTQELSAIELEKHQKNYSRLKKEISKKRVNLKRRTDINEAEKIELAETYISKILIDSVFEYWAGTKWDFNGHTTTPRKGEIACGYYITTPLRDVGVKLNRIKLAQQTASKIIKKLCKPSSIKWFKKREHLDEYLKAIENDEILILGLDNHVGFIFKRNDKHYFAHSNYIGRSGVTKEKLETSRAINASNIYNVGQLTKHKKFIEDWISN